MDHSHLSPPMDQERATPAGTPQPAAAVSPMRLAVIGTGHLGSRHAAHYAAIPGVTLVGVCDLDRSRAEATAQACGTTPYTNYQELLPAIQAASIVVPTALHHAVAQDCLRAGVHVLVEKPMTTTLREADQLLRLARRRRLILQVGHVERFNAAVRAVVEQRRVPRFIECHRLGPFQPRAADVGVVLDLMIHDLDIILHLVQSPVAKIDAIGARILTPHEDIANARLTFRNGAVCNITASRVTTDVLRKIRIFSEESYISLDYVAQEAVCYRRVGQQITREQLPITRDDHLRRELEAFVHCLRTHEQPLVSGQEGREALRVALRIQDQIRLRA